MERAFSERVHGGTIPASIHSRSHPPRVLALRKVLLRRQLKLVNLVHREVSSTSPDKRGQLTGGARSFPSLFNLREFPSCTPLGETNRVDVAGVSGAVALSVTSEALRHSAVTHPQNACERTSIGASRRDSLLPHACPHVVIQLPVGASCACRIERLSRRLSATQSWFGGPRGAAAERGKGHDRIPGHRQLG